MHRHEAGSFVPITQCLTPAVYGEAWECGADSTDRARRGGAHLQSKHSGEGGTKTVSLMLIWATELEPVSKKKRKGEKSQPP